MNQGEKIERAVAQLSVLYANYHRKKEVEPFGLHDFIPHAEPPAVSLDDAMATWH